MLLLPKLSELNRSQVAQRAVETFAIVFTSPILEQDFGLEERVEELSVEELVAQPGVERLDVSVLPG